MRDEISAAVLFLVRLIERSDNFNPSQLEEFKSCLSDLLVERFENHWFPETPFKGQGYRCIRVNECSRRDATLERAASACGLKYDDLKLPVELTIWVDPKEVCCRFGEHKGSYCTLASFPGQDTEVKVVVENCPPEVKLDSPVMTNSKSSSNSLPTSATSIALLPHSTVNDFQTHPVKHAKSKIQNSTSLPQATISSPSIRSPSTTIVGTGSPNNSPTSSTTAHSRNRGQNSPKQGSKPGGRRNWGMHNYQPPLQNWYFPYTWTMASPQSFPIRSTPRSSHPNYRYNWGPQKAPLKV